MQIWHIHGDAMRQNSLMLSYHSYIKGMAALWLEWFLAGDVYSVGFGWDFAELDLWWAMERNAGEHGQTGKKHIFFFSKDAYPSKAALLTRYGADIHIIPTEAYRAEDYEKMIDEIERIQGKV